MPYPFLGVCGALHLEDIWALYTGNDPLGLRGRINLFYTRPALKRSQEIQSANDRLNNSTGSNRLESDLVELFYPIYRAHAVEHRDEAVFTPHLGCPFLTFCFSEAEDGAAYIYFSEKFDEHVRLQEGKFLVQHDLSKQHGKLKGKRLRHAINWHNLTCAFSGADAVMWPTSVTRQSSQAAGLIGEFGSKVCCAMPTRPRWQRRRNRCCGHNPSRRGWWNSKPAMDDLTSYGGGHAGTASASSGSACRQATTNAFEMAWFHLAPVQ